MALRTDEVTALLKQQILNFTVAPTQLDVGEVMEVGDGIALVSGLQGAMSGELLEFTKNGTLVSSLWVSMPTLKKVTWCAPPVVLPQYPSVTP